MKCPTQAPVPFRGDLAALAMAIGDIIGFYTKNPSWMIIGLAAGIVVGILTPFIKKNASPDPLERNALQPA